MINTLASDRPDQPVGKVIPSRRDCCRGLVPHCYKNIETSISLDGTLYRLMTGCLFQNIQLDKLRLNNPANAILTKPIEPLSCLFRYDDRSACRGEALRHTEPNSTISAGHKCNPFLQVGNCRRRFFPPSISDFQMSILASYIEQSPERTFSAAYYCNNLDHPGSRD